VQTIVIANNKGGVGKTTTASQLAYYLMRAGHSVIAVDLDGQRNRTSARQGARIGGNALEMIEQRKAPEFTLAPGELVLIEGERDVPVAADDEGLRSAVEVLGGLGGAEFCIIDTPPAFTGLVYGALISADFMLAPIELKRFSLDGVEAVLRAYVQVQQINKEIGFLGLLPSRFDAVKKTERETLRQVVEAYANLIIPHAIRNRTGYEEAEARGIPVFEVPTRSGKEAAAEFGAFFEWFMQAIEKKED